MSMMIFVLIIMERGEPTGQEFYFQELTSCLEYRDALVMQSTHIHNLVIGRKSNKFDAYCEVRLIPSTEAGKGNYIFRDPIIRKEDD